MDMNAPSGVIEIDVDAVVFRKDLYPRIEHNATTVQQYANDLDVLPPIKVNQHCELIDGWHRWTAHKKAEAQKIKAIITETSSDAEFLELAIECNAKHGLQLSLKDKRDMARHIYNMTPEAERNEKKKKLAALLSVNKDTIYDWLSNIDKDFKAKRKQQMFDLWMACYTQQEIAEALNVTQPTVAGFIKNSEFRKTDKNDDLADGSENGDESSEHADNASFFKGGYSPVALHQVDFEPMLYNVWRQNAKTNEVSHFGNSEVRWVDNLLYSYTQPFDVVVDPFAGGGSTIDICKKRFRRYFVSDRKPTPCVRQVAA